MTTTHRYHRHWILALALILSLEQVLPVSSRADGVDRPAITGVRFDGKQVSVSATVPPGTVKATLESRARFGAGTWEPRAVVRPEGATEITFQLSPNAQLELLRVRTDTEEVLPSSFFKGTNSFSGQVTTYQLAPTAGPVANRDDAAGNAGGETASPDRSVVESDIWKVDGKTLYFFNQYRGLQVVDLSVPDAPRITGVLPLAAAGEQMYQLDSSHLLLLAHNACGWGVQDGSQVLIIRVDNGQPTIERSLPVEGQIQESRLVGTALYVASQSYRVVTNNLATVDGADGSGDTKPDGSSSGTVSTTWSWGSVVTSFDLADPANAAANKPLWFAGYGNTITATDRYLFVATTDPSNWSQSTIQIIDISSPDGSMTPESALRPAGRVADKFKMNLDGDIFTVVSELPLSSGGLITRLETFSLADPSAPKRLAGLDLARGERLHATRFDGDRVYIVTFFTIDPLWVVDLSNPNRPYIAGQVEVPGWSTYIHPLGDRLVTVGIENTNGWRVAVSLFDVADPAKPALLSRVPLGENSSWSEANYDEKAFGVFPDNGLIMVPFQGDTTNGYASQVQLIDLERDSLAARGVIHHQFQPRRTTLLPNRILSLSGQELLTVDATDRDEPRVTSALDLAWSVDRVFHVKDMLVQIAGGNSWDGNAPSIRVSPDNDSDLLLSRLFLSNSLPVIGATVRDDKLYLAQGRGYPVIYYVDGVGESKETATNAPAIDLTVFDLSALPEIRMTGRTQFDTQPFTQDLTAVWPKPDLLVWTGGSGWWGPYDFGGVRLAAPTDGIAADIAFWPYYGGGGGRLWAIDVQNPAAPEPVSEVNLTTNQWWGFSAPLVSGSLVYLSHQTSEFLEGVTVPGQPKPEPIVTVDKETGESTTNYPPYGVWVQKYYLEVVDYGDPVHPTVRRPVNIPGALTGLSHEGAIVYTTGPHWNENGETDWKEWLDASAYDGVNATLVDSLDLGPYWPHPALVENGHVFIGQAQEKTQLGQLQTWRLNDAGRFEQLATLTLAQPLQNLIARDSLLAGQTGSSILIFDISNPAQPQRAGEDSPQSCYWFDLTRAEGDLESGLWIPRGWYGILHIAPGLTPRP